MTERPDTEIAGVAAAHAALDRALETLTAADLQRPSLLPDWSVAHVLAHIARNADSVVRRLQGALDDVVVDQYDGGVAGRAAEIDESATLALPALAAYVRSSSAAVDGLCAVLPVEAWGRESRAVSGALLPAALVVYSRWREVEIHHVDLGLAYTPADWPPAFVARLLPDVLEKLSLRADNPALLAWAIGRADAPELQAWG